MKATGFRFARRAAILLVPFVSALVGGCSSTPAGDPISREIVAERPAPAFASARQDPIEIPEHGESGLDYIKDERPPLPHGWPPRGLWIGVQSGYADVLGDFDGTMMLFGPTDTIFIPDIDAQVGYGATISYRFYKHELLVSYNVFDFDEASFGGVTLPTKFEYVDLMFRRYWLVNTPMQPFLTAGAGWAKAQVENGTTDGVTVQNAFFLDGISLNVGGGLALYPLPWISVFGQGIYRFAKFQSSEGIDGELASSVSFDGWEVMVGAQLRILRGR